MKLYCLSGLGVDERAFMNIEIPGVELIHIPWITPNHKESLKDYSLRLFNSLEINENYSLIGVSFGGMIAQEIAKLREPEKLFLVSTIQNRGELRTIFKLGGFLGLHKLIPKRQFTKSNTFINYLFGAKTKEEKLLLKEILGDTDPNFVSWALQSILKWENSVLRGIGIHGTKDKILPFARRMDHVIEGGEHFMIVSKGEQISKLIEGEVV